MKETVIQFGEGNFLRGFVDYFIHKLNEQGLYDGKVVAVKPTPRGNCDKFIKQNCKYNLFLRGIENSQEVCEHTQVSSISRIINPYEDFKGFLALAHNSDFRFIVSNTTEAGIVFDESCKMTDSPPSSFPAKLTLLLLERFNAGLDGFVMLACELIDKNADELKKCVLKYAELWDLSEDFKKWIEEENSFCNTLVDRIVTGYPTSEAEALFEKIGYEDKLLDTGEIFHLWVIEGDFEAELPLKKAGFNVIWTDDVTPYKKCKVRVLNGAHTSMVFPAMLCGIEAVGECLKDEQINAFLKKCLFDYILPVLGETQENLDFANAVLERFANPYIHHLLKSISLNSVSKFKVRVLPTALDYLENFGEFPSVFAFSLACLIEYYKTNEPTDEENAVKFIKSKSLSEILSNKELWDTDLSMILPTVEECTERIHKASVREALKWILS